MNIYAWSGIFDILFLFFGHFTSVSFMEKQVPVLSLYCSSFAFSCVGYTIILRFSGIVTYTAKIPKAKLNMKTVKFIYLNIGKFVIVFYIKIIFDHSGSI